MPEHSTCRTTGDVQWQILPDWEHVLIGPDGLRLDEWLRDGQAQVVKDGRHRTVYRVDLPDRAVFLKHYRCLEWVSALRNLVRASSSRREWQKMAEVARRRVPTAQPVAMGERQRRGLVLDSYFVTAAIPNAQSLDHYVAEALPALEEHEQVEVGRRILAALARLIAGAHRSGVYHNDLHTGNVLICTDTACTPCAGRSISPQLFLIDLPGVRLSGPVNWPRSRDSLVMLNSGWLGRLSRTNQLRFWQTYLEERPDLAIENPRAAAAEIVWRTREFARRILRRRDKRSLRTNRDYYRLETRAGMIHAVSEVPAEALVRVLHKPDSVLHRYRDRPVKLSHSSLIVEAELPLLDGPVSVAFKRSRAKSWWKCLLGRFRRCRSLQSWYLGHALLQRGIATARPLAVWNPRRSGIRCDSFLATEWITGAENLHLYLWRIADYEPTQRRRRLAHVATALGRLIGRMHGWHVAHRDLKACNLVVVEQSSSVEAHLVDLDGVRLARRLSHATRAQNLARLATSLHAHPWMPRSARLRFLRSYLAELGGEETDWKRLWRDITARSSKIARRLSRRGQPIV